MNTRIHINNRTSVHKAFFGKTLVTTLMILTISSVQATDSYQLKVLFTPTYSDLEAEAGGRVMIYDSLKSETVDNAMNEQFERIDNMMFIRTLQPQDDGEYIAEDDGC